MKREPSRGTSTYQEEGGCPADLIQDLLGDARWLDQEGEEWEGGAWLRDYPAPLFTLPYFTMVAP